MTASVCVVGSFMMDLVAYAPRRPQAGETLIGTGFASFPGGKGFNQAVAAARAGARTAMVGCVGDDDMGVQFRTMLAVEEIDASAVVARPGVGTGVGLPLVESTGQNSIVVVPRANLLVDAAQIDRAAAVITGADVLLLQLELAVEADVEAARVAHEQGVTVVLNPAPMHPLPPELLACVDVVVPNEGELASLIDGMDVDVRQAALAVRDRWGADVVVTLGGHGALVVPRVGAPLQLPAYPVDVVDTVGAGDVFCGYLASGLAEGGDLVAAARFANAAAAISVTRTGSAAAAPTHGEVLAFATAPSVSAIPIRCSDTALT
ncbi:MAG: ribokinase [Micrococcales bacterium]|nr:ribokinase [Micrococcales bacterium]